MMIGPKSYQDLLEDCDRADACLASAVPCGSPQITPVRIDAQGDCILTDASGERAKDRSMRARPAVALLIADAKDSLRYVQIRGAITEVSVNGPLEYFNRLSMKHWSWPWPPVKGPVRVTDRRLPERVSTA